MKPQKAYIIRISSPLSREYSEQTAESCKKIGLDFEFFEGIENKTAYKAWSESGLNARMVGIYKNNKVDGSACATVSHSLLWKKIAERKECAIVLEHDSLMLQPVTFDIPDNAIVALGYKLENPAQYDHIKAGEVKSIYKIDGHEGAHAYAITHVTAELLLKEIKDVGISLPIDNTFFLKTRYTKIPLYIADPTPAICWIRKSTIWPISSNLNYEFIESFKTNLHKDK